MSSRLLHFFLAALLTCFIATSALAKTRPLPAPLPLTPTQSALIDHAVAQEKLTSAALRTHAPVVQTYIQNMRPDEKLGSVPASDVYMLSRVDFGKAFTTAGFAQRRRGHGWLQRSSDAMRQVSVALGFDEEYEPTGFMDMMLVDAGGFDRRNYDFGFVRNEFLGAVRTQVFDVFPRKHTGAGRFQGRIWIEDREAHVVRFNGVFTGNPIFDRPIYFHFDSWRTNQQPGVWLPAMIYVEETRNSHGFDEVDLRAQTTFWGYSLSLPQRETDSETIRIDDVTDQSDAAQDVSPLESSRAWVSQAEGNVLDRLVQAGVLAPPSDFDHVLETVTNNLIIGNKLELPDPIHCRVLLTAPLESLAVGNTILLSKGLIDTLPYEEDLAAVLAFQLAHITLGHHIDTRYAFSDRMMFPDQATFQRVTLNHTTNDDAVAAKKALDLLSNSVYHDRMSNAGLFFAQLRSESKELKALTTPRLGDSLLDDSGVPWLVAMAKDSPKLNVDDVHQIAALPLGSHIKVDAWNDKVTQLSAKAEPLVSARDKMPFEVTPVLFRLTRLGETPPGPSQASSANDVIPLASSQAQQ